MGFAWVALLRVQQTSLLCSIWGGVGLCLSVSFVWGRDLLPKVSWGVFLSGGGVVKRYRT